VNSKLKPPTAPGSTIQTQHNGGANHAAQTYTKKQKLKAVQDIISQKKRPTQVARELNASENSLIKWSKLYAKKSETAFQSVVDEAQTLSRERLLEKKIAELERVLGQTSFENSVMRTALDLLKRTNGSE
jgi:transposase-like protein